MKTSASPFADIDEEEDPQALYDKVGGMSMYREPYLYTFFSNNCVGTYYSHLLHDISPCSEINFKSRYLTVGFYQSANGTGRAEHFND